MMPRTVAEIDQEFRDFLARVCQGLSVRSYRMLLKSIILYCELALDSMKGVADNDPA